MQDDILQQAQEIRTSIDNVTGTMADTDAAKRRFKELNYEYCE